MPLLYTTILSGFAVSGQVDLSKYGHLVAISVPTITSADLLVQGAFDATSANFLRIQRPQFANQFAERGGHGYLHSDFPDSPEKVTEGLPELAWHISASFTTVTFVQPGRKITMKRLSA